MLLRGVTLLAALAACPRLAASHAVEDSFHVVVDHLQSPEMAEYGARAKALCEEWYPKIDLILFGPNHGLVHREIRIVIESGEPKSVKTRGAVGYEVASSFGGVIRIRSKWLESRPKDFEAVIIHELTHVNQDNYALHLRCDGLRAFPCFFQIRLSHPNRGMDWVGESINDYVAWAVFRKTLQPRLRVDKQGYLSGQDDSVPYLHGLEKAKIRIPEKGYALSYAVGASFLLWLELTKDRDIIRKLNVAMSRLRASPKLFRQCCGAPVDRLWREFLAASASSSTEM